MVKIRKRDGRIKDFEFERIEKAVNNAFVETYKNGEDYISIKNEALVKISESLLNLGEEIIDVEKVQDIVIEELYKIDGKVAKAYSDYRAERTFERERRSSANKEIDDIISATSEETTSNGNVDGSKIQSIRALVANIFTRNYARYKYIPKDIQKIQRKEIYVHDEQYFGLPFYNCCNAEWQDMFETGFDLGTTRIERPKSLATAVNVLTQVASHISSNTFGGTTFGDLGSGLLPYAKMSLEKHREVANEFVEESKREEYAWNRLAKEIEDSMQSLEYEVQTLVTSRGETPFLTLGLDCAKEWYSEEDRKIHNMIIKAILNQRLKGLTGGITPVFPKLVFQLKKGTNLNPGEVDYDIFKLAVETSANRQYPDYIMTDRLTEIVGGVKFPMGCRSFKYDGKFNWGVVSINIVRLAILANGDENKFFELLQEQLENCERLFNIRYDILKNVKAKQAPILYMSGAISRLDGEETIERLLYKDWSSISIGYVGLHNCLKALYGEGLENQNMEIVEKGAKIMQYMRDFCDRKKEETGFGYSLYGTPEFAGL